MADWMKHSATGSKKLPSFRMPVSFWLCPLLITSTYAEASDLHQTTVSVAIAAPVATQSARVFFQGMDATAFATQQSGQYIIEIPFPDAEEDFEISIVAQDDTVLSVSRFQWQDGKVVLVGTDSSPDGVVANGAAEKIEAPDLQNTASNEAEVSWTVNGQLDVSALSSVEDGSDYDTSEQLTEGESDALASVRFDHSYGGLTTSFETEAVHRTNDDNTVRYEGPRSDIAQFISTLDFSAADGSVFTVSAGDVSINTGNSLVNSGMSSRGFILGFTTPNERFNWQIGRLYGSDIVGTVEGPLGYSAESYRIGVTANWTVIERSSWNWGIEYSMLEVERPIEDNFGFGETTNGEKNHVWGLGTSLELMDGQLNMSFNWAHSEYDNPDDLNSENLPEEETFEIFQAGQTTGIAYRHEVQWQVWSDSENDRSTSIELQTERATPFYRSVQGQATADRRQWSAFTDTVLGAVSFRAGTTQYRNNLNDLISIHTLEEAIHEGSISVDLQQLAGYSAQSDDSDTGVSEAPWWHRLKPAGLELGIQIQDMKTINGDVIILAPVIEGFDFMDQTTRTTHAALNWERDSSSTTLGVEYNFLDNDQFERRFADARDLVYSVDHEYRADQWYLGGRVGLSTSDDLDTLTRSKNRLVDWGIYGAYDFDNGIALSFGFDKSVNRLDNLADAEREDSDSDTYAVTAELGDWIGSKLQYSLEPSVTLSWQRSYTKDISPYYDANQSSNTVTLNVGVPF